MSFFGLCVSKPNPDAAIVGLALAALLGACASLPPRSSAPKDLAVATQRTAFESWVMAERLFHQGQHDADGDALLVALRLMQRYPATDPALTIESDPDNLASADNPPSPAIVRHALVQLAREVPAPLPPFGPGPRRSAHALLPGLRAFVELPCPAGTSEVAIVSDLHGDLDLWVLATDGRVLCSDLEPGDADCRWTQPAGGTCDLVIDNRGAAATRYSIVLR